MVPKGKLRIAPLFSNPFGIMDRFHQLLLPHFLHHSGNRAPINVEQFRNLSLTLRTEPGSS
jgi:hypothetical protein